jgi:hypothetical protein
MKLNVLSINILMSLDLMVVVAEVLEEKEDVEAMKIYL